MDTRELPSNRPHPAVASGGRPASRHEGVSIVPSARDEHVEPVFDEEVIRLGESGVSLEEQFGGMCKAAYVLAEATQECAGL